MHTYREVCAENTLTIRKTLPVHCAADGNDGGGNEVDTLENMANFVVNSNDDYKDLVPQDGVHNVLQRDLDPLDDPHVGADGSQDQYRVPQG